MVQWKCRQLLEQNNKAYLARTMRAKRWDKKGRWVCTVCRKKKRHVINQQLIAIEGECKARNARQAYRMVQKV
jgi:hypothetical protein